MIVILTNLLKLIGEIIAFVMKKIIAMARIQLSYHRMALLFLKFI